MENRKPYQKPVSELIVFGNDDIITTSGSESGGDGWNNNGNGNDNGHWFPDKPGNGGHHKK